jgi:hypothetical protein
MQDYRRKYMPILIPLVVFLLLLFTLIRYLLPETYGIKARLDKFEEEKEVVRKLENKLLVLDRYTEDELVGFIDKSQFLVPGVEEIPGLLLYFKSIEDQSGVAVGKFDLGENLSTNKSFTQPGVGFEIEVNAPGKENMFRYLSLIGAENKRIVVLSGLIYNLDGEIQTAVPGLGLTLRGHAMYLPFISKIGKVSDDLPELSQKQRELVDLVAKVDSSVGSVEQGEAPAIERRENPFER